MPRKGHHWLLHIPPEAVTAIEEIIGPRERPMWNGERDLARQWWIRRSPTTGMAQNVTLLRKQNGVVIREWVILVNGELTCKH